MASDPGRREPSTLSGMPERRSRVWWGASLAATVFAAGGLSRLLVHAGMLLPIPFATTKAYSIVALVLACAGVAAAHLLTPSTLDAEIPRGRLVRRWGRRLQWCWLPGYALFALMQWDASMQTAAAWLGSLVCRVAAGAGTIALLVLLSRAAWNAELEVASDRIYGSAWALTFSTPLVFLIEWSMTWIAWVIVSGVFVFWAFHMVRVANEFRAIASHVRWEGKSLAREATRLERILERRAELDEEALATYRRRRGGAG